jgi:aldehyde dehydrogenase (NAD+)
MEERKIMTREATMEAMLEELDLQGEQCGAACGGWGGGGGVRRSVVSPADGAVLGSLRQADGADYARVAAAAVEAFRQWRGVPAPRRGEVVRQMGEALRRRKRALGALVSLEMGKIRAEGEGEVQEMIDIADFAVGLSRTIGGPTLPSERPGHRMFEQWHPLGPVGVISAFNFPVAVWAWNAMLALVCGDAVIWKPSSKTPLCAIATLKLLWPVLAQNDAPEGLLGLVVGARGEVGEALLADERLPLISATGSVAMGRRVAQAVAARLGRSLLELGGNNAVIVTPRADLDLALRAILFGAVGTAGQRCTTTRRVIVHETRAEALTRALMEAYAQVTIGHPLDPGVLMGPLVDRAAVEAMQAALGRLEREGGRILMGGAPLRGGLFDTGTYVSPCIAEAPPDAPLLQQETFAPILYLVRYRTLEEAIALHNGVPQGLSSAIFTRDLGEAETFLAAAGSDCGIANVNLGTSGAEIGGAFGGEKETGGGRESGSDAWKSYMRRQTCTVNGSGALPLAQGIRFELGLKNDLKCENDS